MKSAYITVRYYSAIDGTRFKIVSDDRVKQYDVWKFIGHDAWVHINTFFMFRTAYMYVKECMDNE